MVFVFCVSLPFVLDRVLGKFPWLCGSCERRFLHPFPSLRTGQFGRKPWRALSVCSLYMCALFFLRASLS